MNGAAKELGATERELMRRNELLIGEELIEIKRLPLRRVFEVLRLVKDELGDLINISQGNLPAASMRRIISITDPEERQRVTQEELGRLDTSPAALLGLFVEAEPAIYRILALVLDRGTDWIGENVGLAEFARVLAVVGTQELVDTDFFGAVRDVAGIWGQAQKTTETPTNTAGSGELSPN
jgi:hypothetical protein